MTSELLISWCKPTCPSQLSQDGLKCECGGWEWKRHLLYMKGMESGFRKKVIPIIGLIPSLPSIKDRLSE